MADKLYVTPGSHPCVAADTAAQLKGVPLKRVVFVPVLHRVQGKLTYGARTVPAAKIGGEKIVGSSAIMRHLDALAPEPRLYPADPAAAARVEEAEQWGNDVLQSIARRIALYGLARSGVRGLNRYTSNMKLPLPRPLAVPALPLIVRTSAATYRANKDAVRADLTALPGLLDKVDAWIADGVLGGESPNAADLQIGSSLALLHSLDDVRPLIAGRPAAKLVRYFPEPGGTAPAGVLPSATNA